MNDDIAKLEKELDKLREENKKAMVANNNLNMTNYLAKSKDYLNPNNLTPIFLKEFH